MQARYTVHLKTLLEDATAKAKIDEALASYPIYQSASNNPLVLSVLPTRESINTKLLNAYKYREIGFETAGRFIDELGIAMHEIMPLYNQRIHTVEIMSELDNPFDNVDVVETYEETQNTESDNTNKTTSANSTSSESTDTTDNTTTGSDTTTTHNSSTANTKAIKSETPQGELDVATQNIGGVKYADEANWSENISAGEGTSNGSNTATSNSNSEGTTSTTGESEVDSTGNSTTLQTTEHTYTKKGNQGVNTYAHDIIEFRETLLNIEQEIINDIRIRELFMLVY